MKKMTKKVLGLMLVVCLVAGVFPAGADVRAQTKEEGVSGGGQCQEIYEGSNINGQNYRVYGKQATSYLTPMPDGGLMRVQSQTQEDEDGESHWALIEYYDASRKVQVSKTKRIKLDLPRFGGFYAASDSYYILSGQENYEQNADTEVFCITKYDKDWNRISSDGIKNCSTVCPFYASCTRMEAYGKYLLIRTSRLTYKLVDGFNHQTNATIQYDMQQGKVTNYFIGISDETSGYVSHSYNQFLHIENGRLIAVDHGDTYPRSIELIKYPTDVSTGSFQSGACHLVDIMRFPGAGGDNFTGASVGAFEISDSSYLVAGNSGIRGDDRGQTYNVFVAAVDKDTDEVATTWLTDYAEGEESTSTPHMVKLSDNRFVVLWSRESRVYYTVVDGKGNVEASYDMEGELSDCAPVVAEGKITWYTWNNEEITFYDMDVSDLSSCKKTVVTGGHPSYEFAGEKDGVITYQCINCGQQRYEAVCTSYSLSFYEGSFGNLALEDINCHRYKVGDKLYFYISAPAPNPDMETNTEWSIEVSDEEMMRCVVQGNRVDFDGENIVNGYIEMLSPGAASISICPKHNPNIKKSYDVTINSPTESIELSPSSLELEVGETAQIEAIVKPDTADQRVNFYCTGIGYEVSWDNISRPTTENMQITALKPGSTIVTAITEDGKYRAECKVTVRDHAHVGTGKITEAKVTLEKDSYIYDGIAKTPAVAVELNGKKLVPDMDYTVSYHNNVNVGTATVTVTGKGNYTGSKSVTFTITKAGEQPDAKITCKKTVYKVAYGTKPFKINASSKSRMAFTSSKPKIATVNKNTGKVTIKNTGIATITIKAGKASKKVTIKISPKKPSVKSARATKGKKLTVNWAKDKRASGYQVQISTDKKFKKNVKSKDLSKTSYTFTKLKIGKNYYVKIRSYKKSGKETLYSAWSKGKQGGKIKK